MILCNQVACLSCGDKPYSENRHDFKSCNCGIISVDGGMDYLRRYGDMTNVIDISIEMDDDLAQACLENIGEMVSSNRNNRGILCGMVRTLRDNGYHITKIIL